MTDFKLLYYCMDITYRVEGIKSTTKVKGSGFDQRTAILDAIKSSRIDDIVRIDNIREVN